MVIKVFCSVCPPFSWYFVLGNRGNKLFLEHVLSVNGSRFQSSPLPSLEYLGDNNETRGNSLLSHSLILEVPKQPVFFAPPFTSLRVYVMHIQGFWL